MDKLNIQIDAQMFTPMVISVIVLASFLVLFFIWIIVLTVKLSKMKKRIKRFLPYNDTEKIDVEQMLTKYNQNVTEVLAKEEKILKLISDNKQTLSNDIENTNKLIYLTNEKLKNAVQKVSIIRYNPFEGVGGDLCYAIALLDDNNNGIVINSIYSRDACYSYAKEILNGQATKHKLCDEEMQALNKAMNK